MKDNKIIIRRLYAEEYEVIQYCRPKLYCGHPLEIPVKYRVVPISGRHKDRDWEPCRWIDPPDIAVVWVDLFGEFPDWVNLAEEFEEDDE